MSPFELGQQAYREGKALTDNPFICGVTKLGNARLSEGGNDWIAGYNDAKGSRTATAKEIAGAASVDVSRFRRKVNRYYS